MFSIPVSLESPRLTFRRFGIDDWEALCRVFGDPEGVRFTLGTPAPDWMTWRLLAGYVGHWELRGFGPYVVVEKASGRAMGPVGLWYPGEWPEPEITYSLAREFWGKGYASEAVTAVKGMIARELGWKRVISLIHPQNTGSKAVATKAGATYEKTIPFRGDTADVYAYRLTAP